MQIVEREIMANLARCTFLPGSWEKRFARNMGAVADNPDIELTDRQRWWLHKLAWRYRRQMPADLSRHAEGWLAQNPDEPPKKPRGGAPTKTRIEVQAQLDLQP